MIRRIIHIDEEKCNGCGLCADACHEGAIGMVDGKARLLREDYCDGLGDCLPSCPAGAITFEEREAPAYDHAAVTAAQAAKRQSGSAPAAKRQNGPTPAAQQQSGPTPAAQHQGGCPGSRAAVFSRQASMGTPRSAVSASAAVSPTGAAAQDADTLQSQLTQWPVQIKLAPLTAPFFDGAHLLIAADCTAYAYGDFHRRFIRGRITLVGCPKLDSVDYSEKLAEIFARNDLKSITVARMEVPCCGGIEFAVKKALDACGKDIPLDVVTISTDGRIL